MTAYSLLFLETINLSDLLEDSLVNGYFTHRISLLIFSTHQLHAVFQIPKSFNTEAGLMT